MNTVIRDVIKMDFAPGDAWASAMGAWFAIAGVLTIEGESVPASWQYRPSPLQTEEHERDGSWLADYFFDAYRAGDINADDLRHAGDVLMRYSSMLETAGRSY